jgi:hypothetical protein
VFLVALSFSTEEIMSKKETRLRNFDCYRAIREGWCLFNDGELQRIDCPAEQYEGGPEEPVFDSDCHAYCFVAQKAKNKSKYHMEAIEICKIPS